MDDINNITPEFNTALVRRTVPMPSDVIQDECISAGWLMSELDSAAGRHAYQLVGDRVVTVGLEAMSFKKSVFVGDEISVYAEVVNVGRTSITLKLQAWAQRKQTGSTEKVSEGEFTFVKIDEDHNPCAIAQDKIAKMAWDGVNRASTSPVKSTQELPLAQEPDFQDGHYLSLRMVPLPKNTNHIGDIFGGWILEQMDTACLKEAAKHVKNTVVPVGIEAMAFHRPVSVRDEVSFYTKIVHTGTTSVTLDVQCWAWKQDSDMYEKVTEGLFSYVSVNDDLQPVPI